ncbi:MAG TPA: FtsX-like permease family protein, partial [Parafilimonas sp.]|nr:FtsX-like permease family protein [Parafilimonas sp.]
SYYSSLNSQYESFRNTLLQNPAIKDVGRSSRIPTGRLLDGMGASAPGNDSMVPVKADIRYVAVDYDFLPTYGVHIIAGRNFSRAYGTDTAGFILNEAAVKAVGWKSAQQAVGKNFQYGFINNGRIIGVMNDFHFESLHQQIPPMILIMPSVPANQSFFNYVSVKISGNNIAAALATIKDAWQKYLPELPYEYTFLDENFSKLYESEQRQETIFTVFACISIFIACLGLFGLSAFAISQRVKEIGVRKVLGANVSTIVALLSKEFVMLVLIAAPFAFGIAWYAMHEWLQDFAYRINIQWWVFVVAALAALLIALATVSFQAIKAALANPVNSLRTE